MPGNTSRVVCIDFLRWAVPLGAKLEVGIVTKECGMKLTSAQVKKTLSQFDAQALPDNHPAVPELTNLFGDPHLLP